MSESLRAGDEARAHPASDGPQRQDRRKLASSGDAARRKHRHRRDRLNNGRDQDERRQSSVIVTASLNALSDDKVDTVLD
jgi:hypothetical protein